MHQDLLKRVEEQEYLKICEKTKPLITGVKITVKNNVINLVKFFILFNLEIRNYPAKL